MDKNFNKKSAYDAMIEVLYDFDKESPAALERMQSVPEDEEATLYPY